MCALCWLTVKVGSGGPFVPFAPCAVLAFCPSLRAAPTEHRNNQQSRYREKPSWKGKNLAPKQGRTDSCRRIHGPPSKKDRPRQPWTTNAIRNIQKKGWLISKTKPQRPKLRVERAKKRCRKPASTPVQAQPSLNSVQKGQN